MIQCRDKKVVDPTEAEVTRQTLADLQEQVANLTAAVAAMNTQRTAPMNQHERPMQADDNEDSDDDENPFAALRRTTALRNNNNNNDSNSEDDDTTDRWKSSFKLEIPEFKGFAVPEDLLDWLVTVEEIMELKNIPMDLCVPLIAIRFRDRAAAWWSQSKTTHAHLGKTKITSWVKLKKEMQKNFLPYNYDQLMFQKLQILRQGSRTVDEYVTDFFKMLNRVEIQDSEQQLVTRFIGGLRQQIQFTLNLFRPQSISEAHQQALTVEAQIRSGFQGWGSTRQSRQNTATTTSTTPETKTETAVTTVDAAKQHRPSGLRCFSCGEAGHRQSECPSRTHRGLLIEEVDQSQEPIYDESPSETEEELYPDT